MRAALQSVFLIVAAVCIAIWILLEGDTPRPR